MSVNVKTLLAVGTLLCGLNLSAQSTNDSTENTPVVFKYSEVAETELPVLSGLFREFVQTTKITLYKDGSVLLKVIGTQIQIADFSTYENGTYMLSLDPSPNPEFGDATMEYFMIDN